MTWLELKNLSKSYGGVTALRAVNFGLELGEVHALCGENGAGKSTLIKILAGLVQADSGEIVLNGDILRIPTVQASERAGIAVMHQESTAFPDLNAVDNIFVGREITRAGGILLDRPAMRTRTRQLLDRLGESFPLDCPLRELSLAQRQMVALARALSLDCRLLIMDEPTASLSERETARLKSVIHDLRSAGICILYVSHRLDEVFELADRTTVLRDGQLISSRPTSELTRLSLIRDMVGRELSFDLGPDVGRPETTGTSAPALHVQGLSQAGVFEDISFRIARGEILGLAGLVGSGRSEIARAIVGLDACESGMISINGNTFSTWSIEQTIASGLVMVPEDRQHEGLIVEMSVRENLVLTNLDRLTRFGMIQASIVNQIQNQQIDRLQIRIPGPQHSVSSLSGGNQQKVVIGKWLARDPKVLILDEPTRGVDVGAKEQIYGIIRELAKNGMAVLLISSELPELMRLSDNVAVLRNGRIVAQFSAGQKSQEEILALSLPDAPPLPDGQSPPAVGDGIVGDTISAGGELT